MSIRTYFMLISFAIVFMACTILVLGVERGGWMFYVAEAVSIMALVCIVIGYRKVIRPLKIISGGMDLLAQQDFASRLRPVGQRDTDRIVEMFNDMMDRLKQQHLLVRERNQFLDLLINASPMGIITLDAEGKVVAVNKAAVAMLEAQSEQELSGSALETFDHPLSAKAVALPMGETCTVRMADNRIYRCSKLSYMDCGWAHPFILIECLTDEIIAAEQKAYGQVIRVMAHEVNNTMGGITSMLSTMGSVLSDSHPDLSEVMDVCNDRCHELSDFISKYADVVKLPQAMLVPVDLNAFMESSDAFLQTLCTPYGISLSVQPAAHPVFVPLDAMLFRQVLVNIVKNSVESIGTSGEISIEVMHDPMPMMVVTDNGAGISPEVAANLFAPFYSTKPDGSGIGLTLIADILKKHRCRFSLVTSATDGLTRFTIWFTNS